MPKGRVLTPAEREQIVRLHADGASAREIGKQIARSKTVVLNYLKNPAQYAQIKRSGRKRALSRDDEQRLYAALFVPSTASAHQQSVASIGSSSSDALGVSSDALASSNSHNLDGHMSALPALTATTHTHSDIKMSAEQIKREFNVPLSTRRIQQLLSEWRRDARRAHDRQQHEPQAETVGPTASSFDTQDTGTGTGSSSTGTSSTSAGLETLVELQPPPSFDDATSSSLVAQQPPSVDAVHDAVDVAPRDAEATTATSFLLDTANVTTVGDDASEADAASSSAAPAAPAAAAALDMTAIEV